MPTIVKARVSVMYGQVPVEIDVLADDDNGLSFEEIHTEIDRIIGNGFTPRTYSRAGNEGKMDKLGTVKEVKVVPDTKMYEVIGTLDDGAGEFKWREFNATAFRKGDRFKVIKNDRGFYAGQLIIDNGNKKNCRSNPLAARM